MNEQILSFPRLNWESRGEMVCRQSNWQRLSLEEYQQLTLCTLDMGSCTLEIGNFTLDILIVLWQLILYFANYHCTLAMSNWQGCHCRNTNNSLPVLWIGAVVLWKLAILLLAMSNVNTTSSLYCHCRNTDNSLYVSCQGAVVLWQLAIVLLQFSLY